MRGISMIARRLNDGYVQYGWCGNDGRCAVVGARLLSWYNTPDMVEYLFGLGQLKKLEAPESEHTQKPMRTIPAGVPHYIRNEDFKEKRFC